MSVTPSRTVVWSGGRHPGRGVGGDEAPGCQLGEHRLEVVAVGGLVSVDEDQVERALEGGDGVDGRTHQHLDHVSVGAGRDVAAGELGMGRRDLAAGDPTTRRQSGGHGQRGVGTVPPAGPPSSRGSRGWPAGPRPAPRGMGAVPWCARWRTTPMRVRRCRSSSYRKSAGAGIRQGGGRPHRAGDARTIDPRRVAYSQICSPNLTSPARSKRSESKNGTVANTSGTTESRVRSSISRRATT